jgi:hypothetical protein
MCNGIEPNFKPKLKVLEFEKIYIKIIMERFVTRKN